MPAGASKTGDPKYLLTALSGLITLGKAPGLAEAALFLAPIAAWYLTQQCPGATISEEELRKVLESEIIKLTPQATTEDLVRAIEGQLKAKKITNAERAIQLLMWRLEREQSSGVTAIQIAPGKEAEAVAALRKRLDLRALKDIPGAPRDYRSIYWRHVGFFPRLRLSQAIQDFWSGVVDVPAIVLLSGRAGCGKSALLSHLLTTEQQRHAESTDPTHPVVVHLASGSMVSELEVANSLLRQLVVLGGLGGAPQIAAEGQAANGHVRMLQAALAASEPVVLLIDGLDEIQFEEQNSLLDMLAETLPNISVPHRVCLATRLLGGGTMHRLVSMNPAGHLHLDLDSEAWEQISGDDIRGFWLHHQPSLILGVQPISPGWIEQAIEFSEASFLRAATQLRIWQADMLREPNTGWQPPARDLSQMLEKQWERLNAALRDKGLILIRPQHERILRFLGLARSALTGLMLAALLNKDANDALAALETFRDFFSPFLSVTPIASGALAHEPAHSEFQELFVRPHAPGQDAELIAIAINDAQAQFCDILCAWPATKSRNGEEPFRDYAIRYGPHHLIEAGRPDALEARLTDLSFLMAKAEAGLVYDLYADLRRTNAVFP